MSKMKIIDEVADAQVSYIKEALYDSVEWAMSSVEEFEELETLEDVRVTPRVCAMSVNFVKAVSAADFAALLIASTASLIMPVLLLNQADWIAR